MSGSPTWLEQLLAATPPPPATEDIDELVAAFAAMEAARQPIVEAATTCSRTPVVDELASREAAWRRALAKASERVAAQRVAVAQSRRYR